MSEQERGTQASPVPAPSADEGYHRLFHDYPDRESLMHEIQQAFLAGVERFAGKECRDLCERDGLAQIHLHYPHDRVHLLQEFVNSRMKPRLLRWSAEIGRETLGLLGDFLVQDLLVVRVHFPHGAPRRGSDGAKKLPLRDRARYGLAYTLEQIRTAFESKSILKRPAEMLSYLRRRASSGAELPHAYRCHAPHIDSWLGQPIGSLSVWLGVAGVERDNSMCLYPETVGATLPMSETRYLDTGFRLPQPTRPAIADGDLFVFSTEILHSSVLNVTNNTRIAFTTRIDPGSPSFDQDNLWFIENWYSGEALLEGRFLRRKIRGSENCVARRTGEPWTLVSRCFEIEKPFQHGAEQPVAPASELADGEKIAVQFENTRVLVLRDGDELRAFSALCPHQGYHLDDGHHDKAVLTCPGHGLEFDTKTGRSKLDRFKLRTFDVFEREGQIFLK